MGMFFRFLVTGSAIALGLSMGSGPASADPLGGNVYQNTSFAAKIAKFESGAASSCNVWNEQGNATIDPVTWRCTTRGLPARVNSGDYWYDTDGFTFTNVSTGGYYVRFNVSPSSSWRWVANNKWTKIPGGKYASCTWQSGEERYDVYCNVA